MGFGIVFGEGEGMGLISNNMPIHNNTSSGFFYKIKFHSFCSGKCCDFVKVSGNSSQISLIAITITNIRIFKLNCLIQFCS